MAAILTISPVCELLLDLFRFEVALIEVVEAAAAI
jgi:hypothetical protein